jgi:putative endonuclease
MAWVYILLMANHKYYIGSTSDLKRRINEHLLGKSPYTKKFLPFNLAFSAELDCLSSAIKMERYLKRMKSKKLLEAIITTGFLPTIR